MRRALRLPGTPPAKSRRSRPAAATVLLSLSLVTLAGRADEATPAGSGSWLDNWFATSDAAKEAQPHWMTPVVTVTPRLEQEIRYDQSWQTRPNDVTLDNYGNNKGLEIIPSFNTELILGIPAYQVRTDAHGRTTGWTDETFLLKYRFAAANEEHGNYIATGFLGVSVPTGSEAFTNHETIITPTLAVGKGWGGRQSGFDIQSTLGIAIPTADLATLGEPVSWNTAFQAHTGKLWPEIEVNYTYYKDGPRDGHSQTALTAGLVLGRFELSQRLRFIIGGGYQKVVSSYKVFNDNWVLTARLAF